MLVAGLPKAKGPKEHKGSALDAAKAGDKAWVVGPQGLGVDPGL